MLNFYSKDGYLKYQQIAVQGRSGFNLSSRSKTIGTPPIIMFNILIIDPNAPFRKSLKKVLFARFPLFDIEEAPDAHEGLKKVKTSHPNLVFVEIHLPMENGLDIARAIKAVDPGIIIVILTSYDSPEYHNAAAELGIDRVVPKDDWTGEDMIGLVQSFLSDIDIEGQESGEIDQSYRHVK